MSNSEFHIDVTKLKKTSKASDNQSISTIDKAGEEIGFLSRNTKRQGGRKPSPRTGQVHAKVLPGVSEEISNEAKRRGVTQGVIIEECWALYKKK